MWARPLTLSRSGRWPHDSRGSLVPRVTGALEAQPAEMPEVTLHHSRRVPLPTIGTHGNNERIGPAGYRAVRARDPAMVGLAGGRHGPKAGLLWPHAPVLQRARARLGPRGRTRHAQDARHAIAHRPPAWSGADRRAAPGRPWWATARAWIPRCRTRRARSLGLCCEGCCWWDPWARRGRGHRPPPAFGSAQNYRGRSA